MKNMYVKYKIIDGINSFNMVEDIVVESELSIIGIENLLREIHNKDINLVSASENEY